MGDKPNNKSQSKTYLKQSSTTTSLKPTMNKITLNATKPSLQSKLPTTTLKSPTKIPVSSKSTLPLPHQSVDQHTQKLFAETTANFIFPKKDQAIIFNTIDGIPQIEYIRVLSTLTNPSNIKFASRISNNRFCVYFVNKSIVENIINQNHTTNVNNHTISIRKLVNPTKRKIISNFSPIIPHSLILDALTSAGISTASLISFIKPNFSSDDLAHIISFRRQTYINNDDINRLPGSLLIHFKDTDYRIFLTDDTLTCYHCKRMGHISAHCNNILSQQPLHIDEQNINLKLKSIISTDLKFSHFGMTNIDTSHSPHLEKDPNTTITECPETIIDIKIEEENKTFIADLQPPTSSNQIDSSTPNVPQKRSMFEISSTKSAPIPSDLHHQSQKSQSQPLKKNKKLYYVRLFHNIGERILYDRKLLLKHQQPTNKLPPIQIHTR
ncbi:hypothetical protein AGLY_015905 [Aphis glycines]|uniref:CCHC-type domain-containing protein n=1 Tax=Aphis glycines TaxID=307491 RepID=A0A6G0T1A7_APHGL|nr:hypothetical protein AGLY_015905 [Aphis glycines]